ncbi:hypothetical protein MNBD_GAMMA12-594 [hydrothermal vent metagenome]|uniref:TETRATRICOPEPTIDE REPEAT FAMILY PROTEIN n=1 Tax=hydrothermal vent metagenome TaxID=652676 RepID=A0A3B0YM53_9ZZZZ
MKIIKIVLLGAFSFIFTISIIQAIPTNIATQNRFERIKQQAEAGEKRSQYKLAIAYLRGKLIETSVDEAIYWFKKSARQGYLKAAHKLGTIYYFTKSKPSHYKQALYWFTQAANNSYAESQYFLSKLYAEGKGVKRNYVRSLMWLKKAEALDFLIATREISRLKLLIKKSRTTKAITTRVVKKSKPKTQLGKQSDEATTNMATKTPSSDEGTLDSDAENSIDLVSLNKTPIQDSTVTEEKIFNTSKILLSGFWLNNGKPAKQMPSSLNQCRSSQTKMTCMSKRLSKQTEVARVSYKIQSRLINFKPDGTFDIKFRKNYIFVMPLDADDPDPDVVIPGTGWQRGIKKMKCQIVSETQISCKEDQGNMIVRFHK